MSLPEVKCDVNTCAYWIPGDLCRAGTIRVDRLTGAVPGGKDDSRCATFVHRRGVADYLTTLANTNWAELVQEGLRPGWQISPRVACSVRDCLHWREAGPQPGAAAEFPAGCGAGSIQITGPGASLSEETDCATRIPRG